MPTPYHVSGLHGCRRTLLVVRRRHTASASAMSRIPPGACTSSLSQFRSRGAEAVRIPRDDKIEWWVTAGVSRQAIRSIFDMCHPKHFSEFQVPCAPARWRLILELSKLVKSAVRIQQAGMVGCSDPFGSEISCTLLQRRVFLPNAEERGVSGLEPIWTLGPKGLAGAVFGTLPTGVHH